MKHLSLVLFLPYALFFFGCNEATAPSSADSGYDPYSNNQSPKLTPLSTSSDQSVLFIGNSVIYTVDLDVKFQSFANSSGESLYVQSVTIPGGTLYDHVSNEETSVAIASRTWSYVILQENTSGCYDDIEKATFISSLQTLRERILKSSPNASMYLFKRWILEGGYGDYPHSKYVEMTSSCYSEASTASSMPLIPVADVWYDFSNKYPSIDLYSPDRGHASDFGALLTNGVIFKTLFGDASNDSYIKSDLDSSSALKIKATIDEIP